MEKRECSCTVGGNVNWYSHYGRRYGDSLKTTRNKTIIWSSNLSPSHIPWGNQNWKGHLYPIAHCSTIYNSYHWLDGHEFGWTLGVGDGQGGLACFNTWGCKASDTTEQLNRTELRKMILKNLQGSNGETDIDNRLMDMGLGNEGEMYGKSNMVTYITIWKIDSQQEFALWLRNSNRGSVST